MERKDPKQPWEEYYLEFDFTEPFSDQSETAISIDSVKVVDTSNNNEDVTDILYDSTKDNTTGLKAYVWVRAGTDEHVYKFTVRVSGNTYGEKYELDAWLPVKEI